jgi:hypothetical protein
MDWVYGPTAQLVRYLLKHEGLLEPVRERHGDLHRRYVDRMHSTAAPEFMRYLLKYPLLLYYLRLRG